MRIALAVCGRSQVLAIVLAFSVSGALLHQSHSQSLDPERLQGHVDFLAADALSGRETGEPGADSAAAYIARAFESYRLEPLGEDGYYQPFEITTTVAIGQESKLLLKAGGEQRELKLYEEWLPFAFSGAGRAFGPAFDAGYGLEEGDYVGFDSTLRGVVLIDGGTPEDFNPHASGLDPSIRRRTTLARSAGALAVVVSVSKLTVPEDGDPPHAAGVPVVQVLADSSMQAMLSDPLLEVELEAAVSPVRATGYNLVGKVSGSGALVDEIVVIGAHYDHLGMGGSGSLAPDASEPHNGADDNASGTAALLGLADFFSNEPVMGRSLVFAAFAAEEMGLLGSEYLVANPPFDLDDVVAMVNFDMVGRLRDGKVQVFGTETAEEFGDILDRASEGMELSLSRVGDGYGPSDQTSFYARRIPVLHFFTGTHSEYHKPDDDADLINSEGIASVAHLAAGVITELAVRDDRPKLVVQERPAARGGGGYGPYFGTIPDFGEVEGGGLRLSGVRDGSPADVAGIEGGDVVIRFADKEVTNIYDYTYALREHSPGDTVVVRVRRNADELDVTAVLGKRE